MKILSLLLCLILFGCSSPEEPAAEVEAEAEDIETVFDPLVESLDKARAVEDIVMQQKLEMDKALRQMEGEDDESAQ